MGRDSYYPQNFICTKCSTIRKEYIWASQLDTAELTCGLPECNAPLVPHFEEAVGMPMLMTKKMTKAEIKVDRRERSKNHFQKEILPYLPKTDQMHFVAKGHRLQ